MLAQAREREIYHELILGELTAWLSSDRETFDLIVACETFNYFGDLTQVIGPATQKLKTDGVLAFSVEQGQTAPFRLTDSGRYEHHFDHIRHVSETFQLQIAAHHEAFLRSEYGEDVWGHFVCLRKPSEASWNDI